MRRVAQIAMVAVAMASPGFLSAEEATAGEVSLPLENAGFQANLNGNPQGWLTQEASDLIYVWGNGNGGLPAGEGVLAFKSSAEEMYVQQSFPFDRVKAGACGHYTVSFDTGWRSNAADTDMTFVVSLVNPSDRSVLGSAIFHMPTDTTGYNRYRSTGRQSLPIHYDHRRDGLAEAPLALRIAALAPGGDGLVTAWVDNVTVTARKIPEPGTYGLLAAGAAGVLALARRRRRG